MTHTQAIGSPHTTVDERPKALGLVRNDVSGSAAPRHAADVRSHVHTLGYRYVYTVRPSDGIGDPIAYTLAMAAGLGVGIIVVYDLEHVNNQPAVICDAGFDVETVCPRGTWVRSAVPALGMSEHTIVAPPSLFPIGGDR